MSPDDFKKVPPQKAPPSGNGEGGGDVVLQVKKTFEVSSDDNQGDSDNELVSATINSSTQVLQDGSEANSGGVGGYSSGNLSGGQTSFGTSTETPSQNLSGGASTQTQAPSYFSPDVVGANSLGELPQASQTSNSLGEKKVDLQNPNPQTSSQHSSPSQNFNGEKSPESKSQPSQSQNPPNKSEPTTNPQKPNVSGQSQAPTPTGERKEDSKPKEGPSQTPNSQGGKNSEKKDEKSPKNSDPKSSANLNGQKPLKTLDDFAKSNGEKGGNSQSQSKDSQGPKAFGLAGKPKNEEPASPKLSSSKNPSGSSPKLPKGGLKISQGSISKAPLSSKSPLPVNPVAGIKALKTLTDKDATPEEKEKARGNLGAEVGKAIAGFLGGLDPITQAIAGFLGRSLGKAMSFKNIIKGIVISTLVQLSPVILVVFLIAILVSGTSEVNDRILPDFKAMFGEDTGEQINNFYSPPPENNSTFGGNYAIESTNGYYIPRAKQRFELEPYVGTDDNLKNYIPPINFPDTLPEIRPIYWYGADRVANTPGQKVYPQYLVKFNCNGLEKCPQISVNASGKSDVDLVLGAFLHSGFNLFSNSHKSGFESITKKDQPYIQGTINTAKALYDWFKLKQDENAPPENRVMFSEQQLEFTPKDVVRGIIDPNWAPEVGDILFSKTKGNILGSPEQEDESNNKIPDHVEIVENVFFTDYENLYPIIKEDPGIKEIACKGCDEGKLNKCKAKCREDFSVYENDERKACYKECEKENCGERKYNFGIVSPHCKGVEGGKQDIDPLYIDREIYVKPENFKCEGNVKLETVTGICEDIEGSAPSKLIKKAKTMIVVTVGYSGVDLMTQISHSPEYTYIYPPGYNPNMSVGKIYNFDRIISGFTDIPYDNSVFPIDESSIINRPFYKRFSDKTKSCLNLQSKSRTYDQILREGFENMFSNSSLVDDEIIDFLYKKYYSQLPDSGKVEGFNLPITDPLPLDTLEFDISEKRLWRDRKIYVFRWDGYDNPCLGDRYWVQLNFPPVGEKNLYYTKVVGYGRIRTHGIAPNEPQDMEDEECFVSGLVETAKGYHYDLRCDHNYFTPECFERNIWSANKQPSICEAFKEDKEVSNDRCIAQLLAREGNRCNDVLTTGPKCTPADSYNDSTACQIMNPSMMNGNNFADFFTNIMDHKVFSDSEVMEYIDDFPDCNAVEPNLQPQCIRDSFTEKLETLAPKILQDLWNSPNWETVIKPAIDAYVAQMHKQNPEGWKYDKCEMSGHCIYEICGILNNVMQNSAVTNETINEIFGPGFFENTMQGQYWYEHKRQCGGPDVGDLNSDGQNQGLLMEVFGFGNGDIYYNNFVSNACQNMSDAGSVDSVLGNPYDEDGNVVDMTVTEFLGDTFVSMMDDLAIEKLHTISETKCAQDDCACLNRAWMCGVNASNPDLCAQLVLEDYPGFDTSILYP